MSRDLVGVIKKSRPGAHFPKRDRGRGTSQGKSRTEAGHRIAKMEARSRRFLSLLALSLFLLPATAAAWSAKVVGVIDGDSITVLHDGGGEPIRLWGIDCPEKKQDFGTRAEARNL